MVQDATRVVRGHTRIVTTDGELREVTFEDAVPGEAPWFTTRVVHFRGRTADGPFTYYWQTVCLGAAIGHTTSGTCALSAWDSLPAFDHNGVAVVLCYIDLAEFACVSTSSWRAAGELLEEAAQVTGTAYIDRPVGELLWVHIRTQHRIFVADQI